MGSRPGADQGRTGRIGRHRAISVEARYGRRKAELVNSGHGEQGAEFMQRYDPQTEPDPEEWLSLGEIERVELIAEYHKQAGIHLPNAKMHAAFHMVVENQIAAGDEIPVKRNADRLLSEGLDRHEVIHAVGQVLVRHMHEIVRTSGIPDEVDNTKYYAALEALTAENCGEQSDDQIGAHGENTDEHGKNLKPTATLQRPVLDSAYRNVGRNDPCPCGSGKKFKKCCLQ